jgi:hypothetical protein
MRDRRLNAKHGGRFSCKFFDLSFSTGSTFRLSGAFFASALAAGWGTTFTLGYTQKN